LGPIGSNETQQAEKKKRIASKRSRREIGRGVMSPKAEKEKGGVRKQ